MGRATRSTIRSTNAEAELATYRERFQKVKAVALTPEQSRDFIYRLAKEL